MGTGFKVNAVYGGRPMSKDKMELKHKPAILIGTPGRVLDHIDHNRFSIDHIKTLVLDEFDKSLEIGFKEEMGAILSALYALRKRILTSATQGVKIPDFAGVEKPKIINYLQEKTNSQLVLKTVVSPTKNKLDSLVDLLLYLGNQNGIIFCNLKDSIALVSSFLEKNAISHGCFSGGMEQKDRERTLIKFRNGTYPILLATDLAARGIDVPELNYIIHYELPLHVEEFTHRNGRTARVKEKGTAYLLQWKNQLLPAYISSTISEANTSKKDKKEVPFWETLFISGGRKDKISKGDIAGLFFKQGGLTKEQLGVIELKQDCAFVGVPKTQASNLVAALNNTRLKKKKVRIYIL